METVFEFHSGKIRYPYRVSFNSMDASVTEKHGYVKNSIHKSHNDRMGLGAHNYNDFGYDDLCKTIDYIDYRCGGLDQSNLTQLEFGFNIQIPIAAALIIKNNVLMHKLKGPNQVRRFEGSGMYKQFTYNNYIVKIYDKALQYKLPYNLLRFEIKFLKARELRKLGIYKLKDLKNKANLRRLLLKLLERFDELTVIDPFEESDINESDREKLTRYKNPNYWEVDMQRMSSTTRMRHSRDFDSILRRYNLVTLKSRLRESILSKFITLINF
ncbi:hypothetical protein [Nonlabens spongiae]|nr:hypothetical protein [Nonlabens spongiae]